MNLLMCVGEKVYPYGDSWQFAWRNAPVWAKNTKTLLRPSEGNVRALTCPLILQRLLLGYF